MSPYEQWVALLTLMRKRSDVIPDLVPDPVAVGDHDVPVFSNLWQSHRFQNRRVGGVSYMEFVVPG